jgi:16S rRNA (guanine527-N7)-methyltransferase
MKIVEPGIRLTLVEVRRRRLSFLSAVVRELGLKGVSVLSGRAEALLKAQRELGGAFDVVVTRAMGPLRSVLPLAMAFVRPGGRFIASGPPAGKPLPPLPRDPPHHWESLPAAGKTSRRFLIVGKS